MPCRPPGLTSMITTRSVMMLFKSRNSVTFSSSVRWRITPSISALLKNPRSKRRERMSPTSSSR